MDAVATVIAIIDAFADGGARDGLFDDGFRVVGETHAAPLLAFGVPSAGCGDLDRLGLELTFDSITPGAGDHVLVWGGWTGHGEDERAYHVVLEARDGRVVESRFFGDLEQARWFAGL